ncbi:PH domain-containing protein [Actinomyces sp. 565]|uniref:PH domain-containing protein n=1 Tax=Actinomyces sp. 565 TaxID=2057794 RepID=UPI0013A6BDF0|nr:PH domain-containing protein [Actinomyces sp. 565]NDR53047.1 PH domain-containing protein [Actinomyces sp. 565]
MYPSSPSSPDSAPTAADPFTPAGIRFRPVSARLSTARLVLNLILNAVLLIGFLVAGVWVSPWFHIGAVLAVVLTVWEAWLIPRQVRAMGYAMADEHLLWRKGIMFRHISVIPYGRMQFVDTSQGPLARHLGIAEVKLHTASASTDATINGLPIAEAESLRRVLSERGEQRMAGL